MKEKFKLKYSYILLFQVQFLVFLKTKAPSPWRESVVKCDEGCKVEFQ